MNNLENSSLAQSSQSINRLSLKRSKIKKNDDDNSYSNENIDKKKLEGILKKRKKRKEIK